MPPVIFVIDAHSSMVRTIDLKFKCLGSDSHYRCCVEVLGKYRYLNQRYISLRCSNVLQVIDSWSNKKRLNHEYLLHVAITDPTFSLSQLSSYNRVKENQQSVFITDYMNTATKHPIQIQCSCACTKSQTCIDNIGATNRLHWNAVTLNNKLV